MHICNELKLWQESRRPCGYGTHTFSWKKCDVIWRRCSSPTALPFLLLLAAGGHSLAGDGDGGQRRRDTIIGAWVGGRGGEHQHQDRVAAVAIDFTFFGVLRISYTLYTRGRPSITSQYECCALSSETICTSHSSSHCAVRSITQ